MVDLPLRWTGYSARGESRSPQRHYKTLDVAALIALRPMVEAITTKHSAFCFWVYGPRLPDTMRVIEGWNLVFKSELLAWRKAGHFGTGKTTRKSIENAWLATRGKGLPIRDHGVGQYFEAPRGIHSEKPDEAYARLERLYGDVRRLDMFARCPRPGWTPWGNEVTPPSTQGA
jgi:N6-adenosine-specific RNA methylase IME4